MARTKYIGTGATVTIIGLIIWFFASSHFDLQVDGDIVCLGTFEEPCEAYFNVTSDITYYLYNKESVNLNFIPNVKDSYTCKRDGRYSSKVRLDREIYPCGVSWREFNFKDPLTDRYKYVEKFQRNKKKEYKLVVFKFNPEDEIKWGGKITGEDIDPKFLAPYNTLIVCDTKTTTKIIRTSEKCLSRVIYYHNFTFINNISSINETKQEIRYLNSTFTCNQKEVVEFINESVNCRTVGISNNKIQALCPENHKCGVIGRDFCILDLSDGDYNIDLIEAIKEEKWSSDCFPINELRTGNYKIASFKKPPFEVRAK